MPEEQKRRNYLILFIAKKGTGKTTMAKKVAENNPNKIIVVNTDIHPSYSDYEHIDPERLKKWNGKKCVVKCKDETEAIQVADILNKYQTNAFVIFEDAQKYVAENLQDSFRRLVINHRMRGMDICFLYHALKFVPNKIAMNYEIMFLFKTNDGKVNLQSKYGNWDAIDGRRKKINEHPDAHYCQVINDNDAE